MKQQQHDINFKEDSEKNSESQMGFEPTTLRDLDSMVTIESPVAQVVRASD